jgi:CRISPR system Cascade subunit CasE
MSHFFSRVFLERDGLDRRQLAQIACGDAYLDHGLVWRLFPGDGAARDFVFRADRDPDGWPTFLVVSNREPMAVANLLRLDSPKAYAPQLAAGELVQFNLRANPTEATALPLSREELAAYNTKRQATGRKPKECHERRTFHDVIMAAKKRSGHPLPKEASDAERATLEVVGEQAARDWFLKHATDWGLEVVHRENLMTEEIEPALEWNAYRPRRMHHKGRELAFSSLDYQGLARVTDPERLLKSLTQGVGRAKAFGCGLLLVRRI